MVLAVLFTASAASAQDPTGPQPLVCESLPAPAELRPGDLFGCALDAAGPIAVIGSVLDDSAGRDAGALYVYRRGAGGFQQEAFFTAAGVRPGDRLGYAVATDGARIVAGAPFHDDGARDSGGAWVFVRGEQGWVEQGRLVLGGFGGGLGQADQLGYAVDVDGALAAVGAPGDDDRGDAAGAVYVFFFGQDGWRPVAKLTASDAAVGDGFGSSVALAGGSLLVGAPYRDGPGREAGAVYLFTQSDDGSWRQAQQVTGDGGGGSLYGHAVDLDAGRALVGARSDDRAGANAGIAYLYRRGGDGALALVQRLEVPGAVGAGDELGISVALGDGLLLVGARFDDETAIDSGAVYLFRPDAAGRWAAVGKLKLETPTPEDEFGYAVALAGENVFAGAYLDDGAGTDAGVACVFDTGDGNGPCPPVPGCNCPLDPDCTCPADCPVTPTPTDLMTTCTLGSAANSWSIVVSNNGPAASGGTLSVGLPTVPGGSASCTLPPPGGGACPAPITLPTLAAGASSGLYTVSASLPVCYDGTSLIPTAAAFPPAGLPDRAPGNNAVTCPTIAPPATAYDLGVAYAAAPPSTVTAAGGTATLTWGVTVTNAGPGPAAGVVVTVTPPAAPFALVSADPRCSGTSCALAAPLPAGGGTTLSFTYAAEAVGGCTQQGTTFTAAHAATVAAAPPVCDAGASPNAVASSTEVVFPAEQACDADLGVAKSGPTTAVAGGPLGYVVTVTNGGPDDVAGARVSDDLPAELLAPVWSCVASGGAVCPPLPAGDLDVEIDLPAGSEAVFTVDGTALSGFCGPLDNTARVTAPDGVADPDPENDAATVTTVVTPSGGVCALKILPGTYVTVGGIVPYQVLLINGGPAVADGVGDEFRDLLPAEVTLIDAEASSGTVAMAGNTLTWNGAQPSGGIVEVTILAEVGQVAEGLTVCNQGELFAPSFTLTDDPEVIGDADPTCFVVSTNVPALHPAALALLALLLAAGGWWAMRRRCVH